MSPKTASLRAAEPSGHQPPTVASLRAVERPAPDDAWDWESLRAPKPDDSPPARAPPPRAPPAADEHLRVCAALKQRWRVMRRAVPHAERDALRFAPAVFACSLDAPGLKADTPGVEGLRNQGRFPALAAKLKLPSPASPQTSRRLVGAILVLYESGIARVLVQPAEAIATSMVARVAERCVAGTALYARQKLPVRFELLRPGTLDPAALARLAALGACMYGRPAKWLVDGAHGVEVTPELRYSWVPHGPTAYSRVQLLLGRPPELEAKFSEPFAEGQALSRALLVALKKKPIVDRPEFRAWLKRELLPGRITACLLPSMRERLPDVPRRKAPTLTVAASSSGTELRLDATEAFAEARTAPQARVRALLLAHALWGHLPSTWLPDAAWRKLASKLTTDCARPTVWFALDADGGALLLYLRSGREPRLRAISSEAVIERVMAAAAQGHAVEVIATTSGRELEAARLMKLAWSAGTHRGLPLAAHAGGRVIELRDGRFRRYAPERFHAKPRRVVVLDELSWSKSARALGAAVECDVRLEGEQALLAWSAGGIVFRERVPLDVVERHLKSALRICAESPERSKLVLRLDERIERHIKAGRVQNAPSFTAVLRGSLPSGLELELLGQRFEGSELKAAAETMLSALPVGVRGHLDVVSARVGVGQVNGDALHQLYARSLVTRRLRSYVASLVALSTGQTGPK